jgi:hypothetical protein
VDGLMDGCVRYCTVLYCRVRAGVSILPGRDVQAVRRGEPRASEVQRGGEEGRHPQEAQRRGGHDPGQTQVRAV